MHGNAEFIIAREHTEPALIAPWEKWMSLILNCSIVQFGIFLNPILLHISFCYTAL